MIADEDRLLSTTDAQVWARAFCETFGLAAEYVGGEDTMVTWFANAIETGRSAGRRIISGDERDAIFVALGAASMAWNPRPSTEVFDSEYATQVGNELIAFLESPALPRPEEAR